MRRCPEENSLKLPSPARRHDLAPAARKKNEKAMGEGIRAQGTGDGNRGYGVKDMGKGRGSQPFTTVSIEVLSLIIRAAEVAPQCL